MDSNLLFRQSGIFFLIIYFSFHNKSPNKNIYGFNIEKFEMLSYLSGLGKTHNFFFILFLWLNP